MPPNLHSESSSGVAVDDDLVLDVVRFVVLISVPLHELHCLLVAAPPSQAETEECRLELVKEGRLQPGQVPTREIRQHQEQRRFVALVDSSQGCACGFRSTRDHGGRGPSGLKRRLKTGPMSSEHREQYTVHSMQCTVYSTQYTVYSMR